MFSRYSYSTLKRRGVKGKTQGKIMQKALLSYNSCFCVSFTEEYEVCENAMPITTHSNESLWTALQWTSALRNWLNRIPGPVLLLSADPTSPLPAFLTCTGSNWLAPALAAPFLSFSGLLFQLRQSMAFCFCVACLINPQTERRHDVSFNNLLMMSLCEKIILI